MANSSARWLVCWIFIGSRAETFRGLLRPKKTPIPARPASVPLSGHAPSVYIITASEGMLSCRRSGVSSGAVSEVYLLICRAGSDPTCSSVIVSILNGFGGRSVGRTLCIEKF